MGMEKFFDIVCRAGGLRPSAVVLVATVKALKHHGGDPGRRPRGDRGRRRRTSPATSGSSASSGSTPVVAVNRFPGDTDEEVELVRELALEHGAYAAEVNDGFAQGGAGAAALAEAVVAAADAAVELRLRLPARRADRGEDRGDREARLRRGRDLPAEDGAGQDRAVRRDRASTSCRSAWRRRTSRSRTTRRSTNAPTGFTVTVRDLRAYTGAGWIVALCGDMQTMPGYGANPAAVNVDIDDEGRTVGLF